MSRIHITPTILKVSQIIGEARSGSLRLGPDYQRRPVWPKLARSFLIDTMIRGLPIPIIFLRELPADLKQLTVGKEVVDGQQRIRAVLAYVAPHLLASDAAEKDGLGFKLSKAHNKKHGGKTFEELPEELQRRILDYEFFVHVLPSSVSDSQIHEIFSRMNSSGYQLNAQELRNAAFFGEFKSSQYELALRHLECWTDWGLFSAKEIARMKEVEFVSDLSLYLAEGHHGKNKPTLDDAYKRMDEEYPLREVVEERFAHLMDQIGDRWGARLKETPFCQIALFYMLFAATHEFAYKGRKEAQTAPARKLTEKAANAMDQAVQALADYATGNPEFDDHEWKKMDSTTRRIGTEWLLAAAKDA